MGLKFSVSQGPSTWTNESVGYEYVAIYLVLTHVQLVGVPTQVLCSLSSTCCCPLLGLLRFRLRPEDKPTSWVRKIDWSPYAQSLEALTQLPQVGLDSSHFSFRRLHVKLQGRMSYWVQIFELEKKMNTDGSHTSRSRSACRLGE